LHDDAPANAYGALQATNVATARANGSIQTDGRLDLAKLVSNGVVTPYPEAVRKLIATGRYDICIRKAMSASATSVFAKATMGADGKFHADNDALTSAGALPLAFNIWEDQFERYMLTVNDIQHGQMQALRQYKSKITSLHRLFQFSSPDGWWHYDVMYRRTLYQATLQLGTAVTPSWSPHVQLELELFRGCIQAACLECGSGTHFTDQHNLHAASDMRTLHAPAGRPGPPASKKPKVAFTTPPATAPQNTEVCGFFNKARGCKKEERCDRAHVCSKCHEAGHMLDDCPH
jgi:hypothetical protein